jgi:lincosamide and streptogramin A transport system ATP-binding/permease protein
MQNLTSAKSFSLRNFVLRKKGVIMSNITVNNLTFANPGSYDNIFEKVSFVIDTDWKLGFIGRNGRGKTTFLNLLTGKYPFQGSITASVAFDYFPFDVSDFTKTAYEIADGICPQFEDWRLIKELSLLDTGAEVLYRPFVTLSNGERTKVLLAALFLKDNNFLLIDEPTNHLDKNARTIVSKYLNGKKGFMLVSHDRTFLDGCIDHVLSINKADITVQKGNFSSWQRNKENQDNFELAQNEKLKGEIKRLDEATKRTANWADKAERSKIGIDPLKVDNKMGHRVLQGAKSKKMMAQSKTIQNRRQADVEEKSRLLKNVENADALKIKPLTHFSNPLVIFDNVSIMYVGRSVVDGVCFTVSNGERVNVGGKNGSGKSSILKLVIGEQIKHGGTIKTASNLKISYVNQDTSFLKGDLRSFTDTHKIDESLFKAVLHKLGFSRLQFEKDMKGFSGGQKKKVLIAKSLCEEAHLYVWDEPLNFVDVLSRIQIQNLIEEFKPTMLFAEHDKAFTDAVATKTVEL